MTGRIVIRPATLQEIGTLTAICMRSKAHWGYDKAFMKSSREALSVKPGRVRCGDVLVADVDGSPAAVAAIAPDGNGYEIDLFFVDPPMIGRGIGGRLFNALIAHARRRGIVALTILSDPNAAAFYEKMGARRIGSAPSDTIAGRTLPLYEIDLGS